MTNPVHKVEGKHRWTLEAKIPAIETFDHNDRTERTCPWCGTIRITVHPPKGLAFRKWRGRDGREFQSDRTPPCVDAAAQPEIAEVQAL